MLAAPEAIGLYVSGLSVAASAPSSVQRQIYFFASQNMKFAGGNHYHEQIKWLHVGRNWNSNKGAEYDRIFESSSISVAAMSNRCRRLANEFTNFTAQSNIDAIADSITN